MSRLLRRQADSFWLVPALALVLAVALGLGLIELDARYDAVLASRWPGLFGVGASGARGMLSAVATSMITVAGVVFSVTLVALSLAASTYSPRVLRTFMHDRPTQAVFGVFVGTFAYCLVVLRTVRGGTQEGAFVPSLAVLGALVLAFVGVGMLVYFIHHVVVAIQASSILGRVAAEARASIDRLFPESLGEGDDERSDAAPALAWQPLPSPRSGYLVEVDGEGLLEFARRRGAVLRMAVGVGGYAIESRPLAWLSPGAADAEAAARSLAGCYGFGEQRSIAQDPAFGVQQIVDIALRALSPGVNDPTTARMCIDHLAALLVRLARRRMPDLRRYEGGELRVIACGETFESLATLAFEPLLHYAAGHPAVLAALAGAARQVEQAATMPSRRRVMAAYGEAIGSASHSARTASIQAATSSRGTRA